MRPGDLPGAVAGEVLSASASLSTAILEKRTETDAKAKEFQQQA